MNSDLLPQERLLCACATLRQEADTRQAIETALSAPDMPWAAFVQQSVRHGLAQLVAYHFRAFAGDPRIPTDVAACFARMLDGNAKRTEVLFRETARLLQAWESAGIRALILKGVALSRTLYPNHALRNFADIDVLVDADKHALACDIAESIGFLREAFDPSEDQAHTAQVSLCAEDILTDTLAPEFDPIITPEILERHRHRVVVEIHRGLFKLPSNQLRDVDMAPFWESPQIATLPEGTPMSLPSPEATLVHLASHAASHIFRRLLFPVDFTLALERYAAQLDWRRVAALADRYMAREDVYLMLEFVQRDFGAQVPAEALALLAPERRGKPLTLPGVFRAIQEDTSGQNWRALARSTSAREFLTSAWRLLVPPVVMMRRIHQTASPLKLVGFYLLRPFRLLGRMTRIALRSFRPKNRSDLPLGEQERIVPLQQREKQV